ncbi:MAG: hypothetical protein OGMRLDGQ_000706, partial [Candidatus Fervidibacter sp.]
MTPEGLMNLVLLGMGILALGILVTALTSEQRSLTRVLGTVFTLVAGIVLLYAGVGLIVWGATARLTLTEITAIKTKLTLQADMLSGLFLSLIALLSIPSALHSF